jgi:transposase
MKALSLDLRQRILTALQAGQPRAVIADRFAVSESSVYRLQRQWKNEGNLTPKKRPGRPPAVPPKDQAALQALLTQQKEEHQDPTLASLAHAWHQRTGKRIGIATLHRALRGMGKSFKKSAASPRKGTRPSALPSARR